MSDRGYSSPGVGYEEVEEITQNNNVDTLGVGVVGGAVKGPTELTLVHSAREFINTFGNPVESDFGAIAACKLADVTKRLYYKRVVSPSAASAVAGTEINIYQFKTKDLNSEINGAIVRQKFTATGVTTTIIKDGKEVATIGECTYVDPLLDTDFVKIFNRKNKLNLEVVRTEQPLPSNPATKALLEKTVVVDVATLTEENFKVALEINGKAQTVDVGTFNIEQLETIVSTINAGLTGATVSMEVTSEQGTVYSIDISVETAEAGANKTIKVLAAQETDLFAKLNFAGTAKGTDASNVPADVNLQFAGGNDGIEGITAPLVAEGLNEFNDPEGVDISTLLAPGWFDGVVTAKGAAIAADRGDVEFLPDCPKGLSYEEVIDFVNATGEYVDSYKFDSGFIGAYWPWVEEFNVYLGKKIFLPPSVWVAWAFLQNDKKNKCWNAVAGEKRGTLRGATATEARCPKPVRDALYENLINPIVDFSPSGIVIYGNKTCRRTLITENEAPTSFMNVRRMASYVRKLVIKETRGYIFDQNTPTTWRRWTLAISKKLQEIKDGEGIEKFIVKMDATTVSEEDKQNGRCPGKIFCKPVRAAEWFPITFTLTDNEVYFNSADIDTSYTDAEVTAILG